MSHKKTVQDDCQIQQELRMGWMAPTSEKRFSDRCQIVYLSASGLGINEIVSQTHFSRPTVLKWVSRFQTTGFPGLQDAKRAGRPDRLSATLKAQIIAAPEQDHACASCRKVAQKFHVHASTVSRLWRASGLKPHLTRGFNLSKDPHFEEKFWDVLGLYLEPPEKALVLCCDEKTQIQALERTQPGLPPGVGYIKTATHDYYRHGTTTLFAALNYLDGKVISQLQPTHTHKEWLQFLKLIDRETPRELELHLIMDNYATHKHQAVQAWLDRHPRFHVHLTPTSSSWLNLVERFFGEITAHLRNQSFANLKELTNTIVDYLAATNDAPKRFVWHKSGEEILAKINRARAALTKVYETK